MKDCNHIYEQRRRDDIDEEYANCISEMLDIELNFYDIFKLFEIVCSKCNEKHSSCDYKCKHKNKGLWYIDNHLEIHFCIDCAHIGNTKFHSDKRNYTRFSEQYVEKIHKKYYSDVSGVDHMRLITVNRKVAKTQNILKPTNLNSHYKTYKIIQILGIDYTSPLFEFSEKIKNRNDNIWKQICEHKGWKLNEDGSNGPISKTQHVKCKKSDVRVDKFFGIPICQTCRTYCGYNI